MKHITIPPHYKTCSKCNVTFLFPTEWNAHIAHFHLKPRYQTCSKCGQTFLWPNEWNAHLNIEYPNRNWSHKSKPVSEEAKKKLSQILKQGYASGRLNWYVGKRAIFATAEFRAASKQRKKENQAKWQERNREKVRESSRKYERTHKEARVAQCPKKNERRREIACLLRKYDPARSGKIPYTLTDEEKERIRNLWLTTDLTRREIHELVHRGLNQVNQIVKGLVPPSDIALLKRKKWDARQSATKLEEYRNGTLVSWNKGKGKVTPEMRCEMHKRVVKEWRKKNHERVKANDRKWYAANPERVKEKRLRLDHEITLAQFEEMKITQQNKCAVCGFMFNGSFAESPRIDHSHEKNEIRGLLCTSCNMGLGKFSDNSLLVQAAINYLLCKSVKIAVGEFPLFTSVFLVNSPMKDTIRLALVRKQNNYCAICRVSFTSNGHIDHNHVTLRIRGLLCKACNQGLGLFKDSVDILESAKRYLELGGVPEIRALLAESAPFPPKPEASLHTTVPSLSTLEHHDDDALGLKREGF